MNAIRRHGILAAIALVVCMVTAASAAYGQSAVAPEQPGSSGRSPRVSMQSDLYDIDADGTDIAQVLQALSKCSGANMVVSPEVKGEITATLKQMPLEQILDYLAKVQGFGWQKTGNAYLIGPKDKIEPEEKVAPATVEMYVWQCRNVKPADLVTSLKGLFPKLTIAEGPNAVTPVLSSGSSGLGSSEGSSSGSAGTANTTTSSKIILMGDPADVGQAKKIVEQLDTPRAQVLVKVAITEISDTGSNELGIDWTYNDLVLTEAAPESGINFGKFTRNGLTATGAISALIKDGKARLLAQPNLSVLDGESASILIGDRILYPKLIGRTEAGTAMYDAEEEKVGIYLQIAARVGDNGQIVMTLYPQVSLVTSYLKTQAGEYPQISTREARTTVSVKNSETLAIGGLLREDDIKTASKVPLLGDLPIIGQFFKRTKTTKEHTEIVILLTPMLTVQE